MNFSLLQESYPALYEYGQAAEKAMHQNLQVYFVKLRCFAETYVSYVFDELTLVKQTGESLEERLSQVDFVASLPNEIVNKLRLLQLYGDRAIQGDINTLLGWQTKRAMKDAYLLGRWLFKMFVDSEKDYPQYVLPMLTDTVESVSPIDITEELEQVHKMIGDVHTKIPYTMNYDERQAHNRECRSEGLDTIRQDMIEYEAEETEQCLAEVQSTVHNSPATQIISPMQQDSMSAQYTSSNPSRATGEDQSRRTSYTGNVETAQGYAVTTELINPVEVDDFIDDELVKCRVLCPWYSLREEAKGVCRLLVRVLGDRWYTISHITEHEYQIVFTVKGDVHYGSYKLYYKKNGKISRVLQEESMLDEELDGMIMSLEGCSIYTTTPFPRCTPQAEGTDRVVQSAVLEGQGCRFEGSVVDAFQYPRGPVEGIHMYMKWIEDELQVQDIRIANMERGQFYIRTTFTKGYQIGVFNLYYNRQGMITKTIPIESKSTSVAFIEQVLEVINPAQMAYCINM